MTSHGEELTIHRTRSFLESLESRPATSRDEILGKTLAEEGFRIRSALKQREFVALPSAQLADDRILPISSTRPASTPSAEFLLFDTFHAAASIYLSGIFDYSFPQWQNLHILVPTLPEIEVQLHLTSILVNSRKALEGTNLSPLLFLFPLRVAGSRSREVWQREEVLDLLKLVRGGFAVAGAFIVDLEQRWHWRDENFWK
jgi:hypothetical protein